VLCAFIVSTITLRGLNLYHANTYSQSCILWELSSTTLLGMSAEMSLCRSCSVCVFGNNAYRAVNSRVCACIACNSTPDSYRRQPLQLMSAHCQLERLIVIRTAGACSACRDRPWKLARDHRLCVSIGTTKIFDVNVACRYARSLHIPRVICLEGAFSNRTRSLW